MLQTILIGALVITLLAILINTCIHIGIRKGQRDTYDFVARELQLALEQTKADNETGTPIATKLAREMGLVL